MAPFERMRLVFLIFFCGAFAAGAADEHVLKWRGEESVLSSQNDLVRLQRLAGTNAASTSGKNRRGAEQIEALVSSALSATNDSHQQQLLQLARETAAALDNNQRTPMPKRVDLVQLPFVHYRYGGARVGGGLVPAKNLRARGRGTKDRGAIDPVNSTFWTRPTNIAASEMTIGFGRVSRPDFESNIWEYAAPKTSYGAHAGFTARQGEQELKIKFGEVHSEPFAARVFHTLGYNVEPVDYSPGLKVRYDRRLFAEFNSRKPLNTRLTVLGVLPLYTIRFQPRHDAFDFISAAVLKDGRRITSTELKELLLGDGAEWNESAEIKIDHLITRAANVQLKNPQVQNIGPWDFGQLGHEHLRELRGAGLLAAWIGWADSRFDNTRLKVVKTDGSTVLKHYFNDLGGGLGQAEGLTAHRPEDLDAFPMFFTRPEIRQGPGRMTIPFRIVNFQPMERTRAFEAMTVDDARWMARMMAQLSERQIRQALAASGFSESDVEKACMKLLARRVRMLLDLELESGINAARSVLR